MTPDQLLAKRIDYLISMYCALFFKKRDARYVPSHESEKDSAIFHQILLGLIAEDNINEAEDRLFDELDENNREHFEIVLDFYSTINRYDSYHLSECGFTRGEIEEGLWEAAELFGLELPGGAGTVR